jgi:hypothetical protein
MSKLTTILEKLKSFFFQYWWAALIFLFVVVLVIVFARSISEEKTRKKKISDNILICPVRGVLKRKKYAADGNYSEEYYTIKLVKAFLRKGYEIKKEDFEYTIEFGRDGHNRMRVDLLVRKNGKIFVVAEVKNNSREIESAIKHQLLPAMGTLSARQGKDVKHAIYYDGTKKSRIYTKNSDGTLTWRPFP